MKLEQLVAILNANYDESKFACLDTLIKQAAVDIQAAGAFLAATYDRLDKGTIQKHIPEADAMIHRPGSISPDLIFDSLFLEAFNQKTGDIQQLVSVIAEQSGSTQAMNNLIQAVPYMLIGWTQAVVAEFFSVPQPGLSVLTYLQGVNETNIKLSQVYIGLASMIANTSIPQEQVPAQV